MKLNQQYKEHLFKNKEMWPNNLFVMLKLADYEKSQKNYHESIKIYKKCKSFYKIKEVPTTVIYFDEVRRGKTKDKVGVIN